jgi:hypothetical protein
MDDIDSLLCELKLIRWHMEFQIRKAGEAEERKWLEYLDLVDKNHHVKRNLLPRQRTI